MIRFYDIIKSVLRLVLENMAGLKTRKLYTEYKKRLIKTWNEIAPRYHRRWAKDGVGPFKSTDEIIKLAQIRHGDTVLDVACGTGAVTKKILSKIGPQGRVVGIDSSQTAIYIAKNYVKNRSADFIIADAECIHFNEKFDKVTCQYALFFFPDSQKVLRNIKRCMKNNGTLALAVHGNGNTVPFFSSIVDVVTKFIPDYLPKGAPSLDRFGTIPELKREAAKAGFSNIKIMQYQYKYSPGTFAEYWKNYLRYLATPLKQKICELEKKDLKQMKEEIRTKTLPFTKKDGRIVFPWKVLILVAKKP